MLLLKALIGLLSTVGAIETFNLVTDANEKLLADDDQELVTDDAP